VIRKGETLWRISRTYGTTVGALANANQIADPTRVRSGERLWIPPARWKPKNGHTRWEASHPSGRSRKTRFLWPVRGSVTSRYGLRGLAHHDGIDISAKKGTSVRAAEAGRVVHSGDNLSGYGNLVLIRHSGSYTTVYAHNRKNLVQVGQFVEKGDPIAEVGDSGRASAPHLHFEVRQNGSAKNPLHYLP
jgi:murein DD-endopeptidase MepM/ murein hydrolase activator NlpD